MRTNMNERGQLLALSGMIMFRLGHVEHSDLREIFTSEQLIWAAHKVNNAIEYVIDDNFTDPRDES